MQQKVIFYIDKVNIHNHNYLIFFSNALALHTPNTVTNLNLGDYMSDVKTKFELEILAERPIEQHHDSELVITPKKEFLEWFKNTKGIIKDMDIKNQKNGLDIIECPNCRSRVDSNELKRDTEELWHTCSKCNLSFSQTQLKYFTKMIIRLIGGKFNPSESERSKNETYRILSIK